MNPDQVLYIRKTEYRIEKATPEFADIARPRV
jgi:hypothetical protein